MTFTIIPPGFSGLMTKLTQAAATLFVVALAAPMLLSASALSGNLGLSSAGATTVAVNATDIDFDFSGTVSMGFPPIVTSGVVDGNGDSALFDATSASTGSFLPIVGSTVTVADLSSATAPVGTTVSVPFITFSAEPGWTITLTELEGGVDGSAGCLIPIGLAAAGQICSPTGSPFNLQNEGANQVSVSFSFLGTAADGSGIGASAVAGTFSTTFSDTNYQTLLADLTDGDAIVSNAEATIGVTPIPEPSSLSMLLLGTGLLVTSLVHRRYQRR
jgi:hypothetical protein